MSWEQLANNPLLALAAYFLLLLAGKSPLATWLAKVVADGFEMAMDRPKVREVLREEINNAIVAHDSQSQLQGAFSNEERASPGHSDQEKAQGRIQEQGSPAARQAQEEKEVVH